jgi:hypothetical protein
MTALPLGARAQDARLVGLQGRVHTVLTEEFDYQDSVSGQSRGSSYDVYDPEGYQLEVYRYKPDGSVWVHTILTRKGWRIFKSQTTGSAPFETSSMQQIYDGEGRLIETDTYDGNGTLVKKSTNDFEKDRDGTTIVLFRGSSSDGKESVRHIVETTDPVTGISHQIATLNGRPETDWTIERTNSGKPVKDKIVYGDGSSNERVSMPDGSRVEEWHSGQSERHTYQKTDAQGRIIEVIQESGKSYVRCTYSFDKKGRDTGQINYDRSGGILSKSSLEYSDDAAGNWIEKKVFIWDKTRESPQEKLALTSLRTITYYEYGGNVSSREN